MRFRTKLLLTFLAVVLTINGLSMFYFYRQTHDLLIGQLRENVLSIATSAASLIDGNLHAAIKTRQDEASEAYIELRDRLRLIRDANRRSGTYVRYIYTLAPSKEGPETLFFVLDAEESAQDFSHVGDIYKYKGERITLREAYADRDFSHDQWGTWLSAYAPIRNGSRDIVAMVGVDISAENVELALMPLQIAALISLSGALVLTVAGGLGLASRVSRPLLAIRAILQRIGAGDLEVKAPIRTKDEFGEVAASINEMVVGLRERKAVKSAFARYVSNQVLDSILESGGTPHVHGDRRRITALFSDIRSFTTLAEDLSPENVVELLNEYFAEMVEVIFRNKGTLDKFMGDGLMVLFGAPADDKEHEEHAIRAAIEMQDKIHRLSSKWEAQGKIGIRVGIGIHSGPAIVGNIGTEERMEYTAIGDTVNVASRLEGATKELGVDILISESTLSGVPGRFRTRRVGEVHVRGRHDSVMTYTIEAVEAGTATSSSSA